MQSLNVILIPDSAADIRKAIVLESGVFFYENGISIVAQANNARNEAYRTTLAIQEFAAKANSAEVLYKHGEYTAEDYLKLAATHFDTDKIVTILHTYAEEEEKASAVNAATPEQPNQVNTANEDFD